VLFLAPLMLVAATLSPRPAASLRCGGYLLLLVTALTLLLSHVPRNLIPAATMSFVGFMFVLGFVRYYRSTPIERKFGPLAPYMAAHRSGDYESVLRLCDGPALRRVPEALADLLQGAALYQLRRLDEAESLLQGALAKRPARVTEALIQEQLAQIFMEQARKDDAVSCCRRSEELNPQRGGAFQCEAEVYLRGQYQIQKALELAEHAVDVDRKLPSELQAVSLSSSLAVLAWALAANGRTSEARESVREALDRTEQDSVPSGGGPLSGRTRDARDRGPEHRFANTFRRSRTWTRTATSVSWRGRNSI
jgi:tetratricopeptide (TPR) repeat protein